MRASLNQTLGVTLEAETPEDRVVLLRLWQHGAKLNATNVASTWLNLSFGDLVQQPEKSRLTAHHSPLGGD